MPWFDLKHATISILDGTTPTANRLAIKVGEGSLKYNEHKVRQYYRDRGRLDQVRDGDEDPVDVSFDATWEFITGDAETTIEDALKQRNHASAWVSTDSDTCAPYAVDIEIKYEPVCPSVMAEVILLPDFRYEQLDHDAKAGTIAASGKCNVIEADSSRVSNSS